MAIKAWVAISVAHRDQVRAGTMWVSHGGLTEFPTQDGALSFCGKGCINITSKTQTIASYLNLRHDPVEQTDDIQEQ